VFGGSKEVYIGGPNLFAEIPELGRFLVEINAIQINEVQSGCMGVDRDGHGVAEHIICLEDW
jgi:hypothetical protein